MNRPSALLALALAGLTLASCKALVRYFTTDERTGNQITASLEDGLQEGQYRETLRGRPDVVVFEGEYDAGVRVGDWVSSYDNGQKKWEGAFGRNGRRTGPWRWYFASGAVQSEGSYADDRETGPWRFYYDNDGGVKREGVFANGQLVGTWTYYHPGGAMRAEGLWYERQRVGPWSFWEGGMKTSRDFGTPQGCQLIAERWPTGELRRVGLLRGSTPLGQWMLHYPNGKPRFCCTFEDGRPSGSFCCWNADGSRAIAGTLSDNKTVADATTWSGDGERRVGQTMIMPPEEVDPDGQPQPFKPDDVGWSVSLALEETGRRLQSPGAAQPVPPTPAAVVERFDQEPARPAPPDHPFTHAQKEAIPILKKVFDDGTTPGGQSVDGGIYSGPAAKSMPAKPVFREQMSEAERDRRELAVMQAPPFDTLTRADGREIQLRNEGRTILVVFLRGYDGSVCHYCYAQTQALMNRKRDLEDQQVKTFVVYPGEREDRDMFVRKLNEDTGGAGAPFDICYDPGYELSESLRLGGGGRIYPTSIVIQDGKIRHVDIGRDRSDRPSVKALIQRIEQLRRN